MSYLNPQAIVSTEWLSRNINDPNLVVLDGTYHLPTANRNTSEEFPLKHIEGAVFFDIDDIADADNVLPHMLPSDEVFSEKVGALGINNEKRVVVYDVYGMQSAARTWWMFRFFGHVYLAVLDGDFLANIYEDYGHRLLEKNVRVFLGTSRKINAGIQKTIQNEPEMFFAYNNGITATAEDIKTQVTKGGRVITTLVNLQIVNGGQTLSLIHI